MIHEYDCLLRPLEESDLEQVLAWRNSERIRKSMFSDEIISLADHLAWYERIKQSKHDIYQIFELCAKPVGLVCFTEISQHRRCSWGFYLGYEGLPKGTGSAMGYLALDSLFRETSIRKVTGEVLKNNAVSTAFHRKLGFVLEGELRDHVCKGSAFMNVLVFSHFRDSWLENRGNLFHDIFLPRD